MRRAFRSYKALTLKSYRVAVFVVRPLFMLAAAFILMWTSGEKDGLYPENLLFAFAAAGDVMLDGALFGGICQRGAACLGYMRTSDRGMAVFSGGLLVDMLFRFLYYMLIGGWCFLFTGLSQDFAAAALAYTAVTATICFTRHFDNWQVDLLCSAGIAILFSVLYLTFGILQNRLAVDLQPAAAVLCVTVSYAAARHMSWCLKRSYYEKESL